MVLSLSLSPPEIFFTLAIFLGGGGEGRFTASGSVTTRERMKPPKVLDVVKMSISRGRSRSRWLIRFPFLREKETKPKVLGGIFVPCHTTHYRRGFEVDDGDILTDRQQTSTTHVFWTHRRSARQTSAANSFPAPTHSVCLPDSGIVQGGRAIISSVE